MGLVVEIGHKQRHKKRGLGLAKQPNREEQEQNCKGKTPGNP